MEVRHTDISVDYFIALMYRAGDDVMAIYHQPITVSYKDDNSPLTEADKCANQLLISGIHEQYPCTHIISEESKQTPYSERQQWSSCWLIDPIDGTKEFVKRNGQFTLNIALIEEGEVTFGMVYAPAMQLLYYGMKGKGAYRIRTGITTRLPIDGTSTDTLRIVASNSHINGATRDYIAHIQQSQSKPIEIIPLGSSLKICRVAEGSADIYPRYGTTMEWDTAAAHAVARYAGVEIRHASTGEPLLYNKPDLQNPPFIVQR
jgi:3'(2'), 5'-bisphosphate nucleotidase